MEAKISKLREGLLLSGDLPPGLSSAGSVEIFPLRDGAYLVLAKGIIEAAQKRASAQGMPPEAAASAPFGQARERGNASGQQGIDAKEAALLRKLLAVRFESRAPAQVDMMLSTEEKATLSALLKKRLVSVFHGQKYGSGGVYNVSDAAFTLVREPQASHAPANAAPGAAGVLERNGFLVLESEGEAKLLGNALAEKVKSGEVQGLRAFDRKYYFVTKDYLERNSAKISSCLGRAGRGEQEVAKEAMLPLEGCRAILLHMCESGDALEKAPGKFARA